MSEIIKNKLYLGDMVNANNERELNTKNVTCVICVAEDVVIKLDNPNIKIYKYNLQDNYDCNISLYFDEIGSIIDKENIVLVNCAAGISRSSTIVIAYIMKYYNYNLREALLYVKNRRNIICPNMRFLHYLLEYEKKLFKKNSVTYGELVKLIIT